MAKFIGIVLTLVIVFGFVVPQFFLSKSFSMDRGATIDATPAAIRAKVSDLRTWNSWTVWNETEDPTIKWTYAGEPGTVGHSMEWTADKLGNGKLTLTEVTDSRVGYDMVFDGMAPSQGAVTYTPADGGTAVNWNFAGEFDGMPYWRYFGLAMPKLMGPKFDENLTNLEAAIKGGAAGDAPEAGDQGEPSDGPSDGQSEPAAEDGK